MYQDAYHMLNEYQQKESKKEDSTQGECAYFRLARSTRGGV